MPWTPEWRAHFFGSDINPGTAGIAAQSEAEADAAFLERYCSEDRPSPPAAVKNTGTRTRLNGISVFQVRNALNWLAKSIPEADHSTPGWNEEAKELPLVAIGRLDAGNKIQKPRCGLCVCEGELYFWSDQETIQNYGLMSADWLMWRNEPKLKPKLRYKTSISTTASGNFGPQAPPVERFLEIFRQRLSVPELSPRVPRTVNV